MKQPKYIRIYDNNGKTNDRFTVVFTKKRVHDQFLYIGLNEYPFHPMGYAQSGSSDQLIDKPEYSHLGKKITWNELNNDCKKAINEYYEYVWDITEENKKENLFN